MKILKGCHAGQHATLHQFSNGWLSVTLDDGRPAIVGPAMVEVEPDERQQFAVPDPRRHGKFFDWWRLEEDGTFTALPPASPTPQSESSITPGRPPRSAGADLSVWPPMFTNRLCRTPATSSVGGSGELEPLRTT